jgi:alpha-tubulin suppressor-like RCC1 family protein
VFPLNWEVNNESNLYMKRGFRKKISAVSFFILLTSLGAHSQVVAWGRNPYGETNVPANATNAVSVAAGGFGSAALRADGMVVPFGLASWSPLPAEATNLVAVALQADVNLALRADGTVFSWGNSARLAAPLTNVVAIAAGAFHGLAAKSDGTVVAWGDNSYRATNVPAGLNGVVAVAAGDYHSLALKGDGTVVAWGWPDKGQTNVPAGLTNVVAIAGTYSESLALKSDGSLVIWGTATNVPANATNIVAITSAENHFIVLKADGTLAAWGDDTYGETDIPAGLTNVIAIAAGAQHNVALVGGGAPRVFQQPLGMTVPAGLSCVFASQASGTVPMHYQWQFNGTNLPGANASTLLLTNIQYAAQGLYSVVASNATGTNTSLGAQLTVVPVIITAQPTNQTVYGGDTATLAVAALGTSLRYAWSFNSTNLPGATNATLSLSNVTTNEAGSYSVLVTSDYGSLQSSNAQLTVVPIAISEQPTDAGLHEGNTFSFSVTAIKNGPFSYQWQFNGSNLPDQTNATLLLSPIVTNNAGIYSVLVANPYGSIQSSNATLTVYTPFFDSQPADASVYGGDSASFNVTAYGYQLNYQWQLNGTNVSGATNNSLSLSNLTTNQAGAYHVLASNSYRTITSSNAMLTITPLVLLSQPAGNSLYVGDTALFSVLAYKNGPFTYQWRFNGTDLTGLTNSSLTVTNLATTNSGNYTVLVSSPYGSLESSNAVLSVTDAKPIISKQPSSAGFCPGSIATFQVTANGSKPLLYQWLFNGTNYPTATNSTLALTNITSANAGTYSVVVSNAAGAALSSNAALVILNVMTWGSTNGYGLNLVPLDLTNAVAIAAGYSHSVALKSSGRVVVWGDNYWGQTNVPANLSNVVAIAAGNNHTLALRTNGTVVSWGSGGTNIPSGLTNVVAIAAGDYFSLALKSDRTVAAWGDGGYVGTATNVPANLTNAVGIAAGGTFGAALKADGSVTVWGAAISTNGMTNVVAIAANEFPLLALKANGTVVAAGVINPPANLSNFVAVASGRYHALGLRANGSVTNWTGVSPQAPAGLTNVAVIASGQNHCLAIIGGGPQMTPFAFANLNRNSNRFSLTVPAQPGRLYWLEYKNSLAETNWKPLPLNLSTGAVVNLTDSLATNSARFYRAKQW